MKLVLLQPPVEDFYDTDIRLQPIGLAYLKAAVAKHLPDIQVTLKDFHHGWGRKTLALPEELSYLKNYYPWADKSPFSVFHQYYHFGADYETIGREVAREKPDWVGISSLFSPYYREVLNCARAVKKEMPNVPVLVGGSHVSAIPDHLLRNEYVDFAIQGEGERPLVEFLKAYRDKKSFEKVPNLGFKQNGRIILNPREENYGIEELPVPDFSDFDLIHYQFERKPLSFLITSRSCPHRCSFCSVHQTFGFRYQRVSVKRVLDEIQSRYRQGIRVFDFEDDNLTFYQNEMKELCRKLIKMFPLRDVEFLAMNGISYLSMDSEMLELMKAAGFTHLNIALVSSDLTVRETTKRPHTIKKYVEVVTEAARLGFKIVSYQILGLPNETLESMIQTLIFSARLPVLLGASMFYLTPNSPMAKDFPPATDEAIFKARLSAMAIPSPYFEREDIYTLFVTTRILDFLKSLSLEENGAELEFALSGISEKDLRARIGADVLKRLLTEHRLYAYTSKGLKELTQFKPELFVRIWNSLRWIKTTENRTLTLPIVSLPGSDKIHAPLTYQKSMVSV